MACTLWGSFAEEMDTYLNKGETDNVVVKILLMCRLKTFNGTILWFFLSQLSICRVALIKLSHLFFYQIIYIGEMGIANAYHGTKSMSNPKIEEVD